VEKAVLARDVKYALQVEKSFLTKNMKIDGKFYQRLVRGFTKLPSTLRKLVDQSNHKATAIGEELPPNTGCFCYVTEARRTKTFQSVGKLLWVNVAGFVVDVAITTKNFR